MPIGPTELVVITFPGERIAPAISQQLADVVAGGAVTILDLVFVFVDKDGDITVAEAEEDSGAFGFGDVPANLLGLASDEDIATIAESLPAGTSAEIVVYEHSWARHLAESIVDAGGEVALHVQVPHEDAEKALATVVS